MAGSQAIAGIRPASVGVMARGALAALLALAVAGCDDAGNFSLRGPASAGTADVTRAATSGGQIIERDVEAPEIFQVTEAGLWDGRPSLGGIWVAHPDVTDPQRVIIRNRDNGKFVVGALFRRERDNPGPALQVSSDAAAELGLLPGAPTTLNVTALRREEVAPQPEPEMVAAEPSIETGETTDLAEPTEIATSALDPIAGAAAAIDAAEASTSGASSFVMPASAVATPTPAAAAPAPAPAPVQAAASSSLQAPYIQIATYGVEANATAAADHMRTIGLTPIVRAQETDGRPVWRVIVGPALTDADRDGMLDKVRREGYRDAYIVAG